MCKMQLVVLQIDWQDNFKAYYIIIFLMDSKQHNPRIINILPLNGRLW